MKNAQNNYAHTLLSHNYYPQLCQGTNSAQCMQQYTDLCMGLHPQQFDWTHCLVNYSMKAKTSCQLLINELIQK